MDRATPLNSPPLGSARPTMKASSCSHMGRAEHVLARYQKAQYGSLHHRLCFLLTEMTFSLPWRAGLHANCKTDDSSKEVLAVRFAFSSASANEQLL